MDAEKTIDLFVNNFVTKTRRERSAWALRSEKRRMEFTDRLSHGWDTLLEMKYVNKIVDVPDDLQFVMKSLDVRKETPCYIISVYADVDNMVMPFGEAFDKVYGRGLASLLVTLAGDRFYLETELDYGTQNRFIGKR